MDNPKDSSFAAQLKRVRNMRSVPTAILDSPKVFRATPRVFQDTPKVFQDTPKVSATDAKFSINSKKTIKKQKKIMAKIELNLTKNTNEAIEGTSASIITAALTALGTTSCMGHGPIAL